MMKIYLACPMPTYHTKKYRDNVTKVKRQYPAATVQEVKGLYNGARDFRDTYQEHVSSSDLFIFFADTDASIGLGVYDEIQCAQSYGIPIIYLDNETWTLQLINDGSSWQKYARVVTD